MRKQDKLELAVSIIAVCCCIWLVTDTMIRVHGYKQTSAEKATMKIK